MARLLNLVLKRVLLGIVTLVGLTIITFVLSHAGGPTLAVSTYINPRSPVPAAEQIKLLEQQFHLNDPLYIQYFYYMSGLLSGQWGYTDTTVFNGPVTTAIEYFLPNTIELSVLAIFIIITVGIRLGVFSASRQDGIADNVIRVLSFVGIALPAFWLALLLQETFASNVVSNWLDVLPLDGNVSRTLVINLPWYQEGISYPTHFLFIDALLHGDFAIAASNFLHLILPAFTIAMTSLAIIVRMMRSSTIDSLHQDYIKTVRMKGIPERKVIRYHAQRNAMIPTATVLGILFAFMLSGVAIVEYVFDYPGIGQWIVSAFLQDNIAGIMGANLVFGMILIASNITIDILYLFIDPRIKY